MPVSNFKYSVENKDTDKNQQRIYKIKEIEEDLSENNQTVNNSNQSKSKKKNKKSKNKPKKKSKDASTSKTENESKKLYEINDIDLLCDMIENPNKSKIGTTSKPQSKNRKKSKPATKNKSNSPEDKPKNSKNKDKEEMGKENKPNNDQPGGPKVTKGGTSKHSQHEPPKEVKTHEVSGGSDDLTDMDDLKEFMKNTIKSKRKVQIKPNLPMMWVSSLKAKLAIIQSK